MFGVWLRLGKTNRKTKFVVGLCLGFEQKLRNFVVGLWLRLGPLVTLREKYRKTPFFDRPLVKGRAKVEKTYFVVGLWSRLGQT